MRRTVNGGVDGKGLAVSILEASTVNGGVEVELAGPLGRRQRLAWSASTAASRWRCPTAVRRQSTARVTNGGISTTGLDFELDRRADPAALRRHAERGRRAVTLRTTNGGVRMSKSNHS